MLRTTLLATLFVIATTFSPADAATAGANPAAAKKPYDKNAHISRDYVDTLPLNAHCEFKEGTKLCGLGLGCVENMAGKFKLGGTCKVSKFGPLVENDPCTYKSKKPDCDYRLFCDLKDRRNLTLGGVCRRRVFRGEACQIFPTGWGDATSHNCHDGHCYPNDLKNPQAGGVCIEEDEPSEGEECDIEWHDDPPSYWCAKGMRCSFKNFLEPTAGGVCTARFKEATKEGEFCNPGGAEPVFCSNQFDCLPKDKSKPALGGTCGVSAED